jgi:Uma2 family endonuclease
MSAALLLPFDTANETLPRKKFTRAEMERLTAEGFFEGQRYELINGDLIDKMGQKPQHGSTIQRLMAALLKCFDPFRIRIQMAMDVAPADSNLSVPEPDLVVLREWKPDYDVRYPRGNECILVVEVSDTTVRSDLTQKAALYARAVVPEYWVLDLKGRRLVIHRHPRDGAYNFVQFFSESESVSLEGRTEIICVAELLPTTAPGTEQ